MCTITERFSNWAMNIESDATSTSHPHYHLHAARGGASSSPSGLRVDRDSGSVDSRGNAPGGEELPKGYTPRSADVCCGRGKKNWRHQGNAAFRKLIHANVPAYMEATSKHDKTLVVKSIVDVVRSNGGRFLKQGDTGSWYDIGDTQAKEKVGHSLRDQVTALSKQKKDSVSGTSLRDQVSLFNQRKDSKSPSHAATPRRSSSASFSPYSSGQGSTSSVARGTAASPSPLNIISSLPTDLSGILEHIHFPSIQHHSSASSLPAATLNPLEGSASSFHYASSPDLNASVGRGMVNFYAPLDESMEPLPIREFEQQQSQQRQQLYQQQQLQQKQQDHLNSISRHQGPPRPPYGM